MLSTGMLDSFCQNPLCLDLSVRGRHINRRSTEGQDVSTKSISFSISLREDLLIHLKLTFGLEPGRGKPPPYGAAETSPKQFG